MCDDVYYYIGERLKLEGKTENMGSMEEMRGAGFAGSAPPFRGRERAAFDIAPVLMFVRSAAATKELKLFSCLKLKITVCI